MNKLTAAYKAYISWLNTLPKPAQTLVLAIEGALGAVVYNYLTSPKGLCFDATCLRSILTATGLAVSYALHNWAKSSFLAQFANNGGQAK
jgi:hypothetical protein